MTSWRAALAALSLTACRAEPAAAQKAAPSAAPRPPSLEAPPGPGPRPDLELADIEQAACDPPLPSPELCRIARSFGAAGPLGAPPGDELSTYVGSRYEIAVNALGAPQPGVKRQHVFFSLQADAEDAGSQRSAVMHTLRRIGPEEDAELTRLEARLSTGAPPSPGAPLETASPPTPGVLVSLEPTAGASLYFHLPAFGKGYVRRAGEHLVVIFWDRTDGELVSVSCAELFRLP